jgi:hypothetical protein
MIEIEKFKGMTVAELAELSRDEFGVASEFADRVYLAAEARCPTEPVELPLPAFAPRVSELDHIYPEDIAQCLCEDTDRCRPLWFGMQGVPRELLSDGEKEMLKLLQQYFDDFLAFLSSRRDDPRILGWAYDQTHCIDEDQYWMFDGMKR